MSRKWIFVFAVLSFALFLLGLWLLDATAPSGIQTKGDSSAALAYVALSTSVVTLLTSIAGLIKLLIELKKAKA